MLDWVKLVILLWCQSGPKNYFTMSTIRQQKIVGPAFRGVHSGSRNESISAVKLNMASKSYRSSTDSRPITKVAIVGGGLAGLSTAYHLLEISGNVEDRFRGGIQITIFDKTSVGEGGASSVAGG